MSIERPYLLFLADAPDQLAAKTAQGISDWRPEWCLGQLRLPDCNADLGLADLSLEQAAEAGARTLVVGVANRGGVISDGWIEVLERALIRRERTDEWPIRAPERRAAPLVARADLLVH